MITDNREHRFISNSEEAELFFSAGNKQTEQHTA
jgi:hypothetical protein